MQTLTDRPDGINRNVASLITFRAVVAITLFNSNKIWKDSGLRWVQILFPSNQVRDFLFKPSHLGIVFSDTELPTFIYKLFIYSSHEKSLSIVSQAQVI